MRFRLSMPSLMRDVGRLEATAVTSKSRSDLASPLVGRQVLSLERRDHSWAFSFDQNVCLIAETVWRLLRDGTIVRTSEDHEQRFGLPAPVDAISDAKGHLLGNSVLTAEIQDVTGDLLVTFSGGVFLQILQLSSGYESWHLTSQGGDTICLGGGEIAFIARGK
jgi:hypothetical protein